LRSIGVPEDLPLHVEPTMPQPEGLGAPALDWQPIREHITIPTTIRSGGVLRNISLPPLKLDGSAGIFSTENTTGENSPVDNYAC
jgi:hypothetical protein